MPVQKPKNIQELINLTSWESANNLILVNQLKTRDFHEIGTILTLNADGKFFQQRTNF